MQTQQQADQGDELSQLGHQAAALDASLGAELAPQPAPGEAPEAVPPSNAEVLADLLKVAGSMLQAVYPATGKAIEAKAATMAASASPVLDKYGVCLGESIGRWSAELGMLVVWLPAGIEIAGAVRADRATYQALALKQQQEREAANNGEAPQAIAA